MPRPRRGRRHPLGESDMDFELPEDLRMMRETVARFVKTELMPLEKTVIRREAERGLSDTPVIPPDAAAELERKSKALGLWGIDVPAEFGGQELGALDRKSTRLNSSH